MSFLMLVDQGASLAELAKAADALDAEQRLALLDELTPSRLKKLYALAASANEAPPVSTTLLVPPTTPPGHTVVWHGRNNLPLFRRFQKRFARGDASAGDLVVGQNYNTSQVATVFGGPGYFLALPNPRRPSELLFDYERYPPRPPPGWPKVSSNRAGTHWLVYGMYNDSFRPLGKHLGIGATFKPKSGKPGGQYFLLARGKTTAVGSV